MGISPEFHVNGAFVAPVPVGSEIDTLAAPFTLTSELPSTYVMPSGRVWQVDTS